MDPLRQDVSGGRKRVMEITKTNSSSLFPTKQVNHHNDPKVLHLKILGVQDQCAFIRSGFASLKIK